MRRIVLALMSTIAAVVLLFGYRTSTGSGTASASSTVATGSAGGSPDTSSGTSAGSSGSTATAPSTGSTSGSTSSGTKTVTGSTAQTRWGPVQVQITVSSGKITAVDVLQVPANNGRDVEINDYAVPVLKQETLQAQSAKIDSISGATVTTNGYISSLQSALDQAGL